VLFVYKYLFLSEISFFSLEIVKSNSNIIAPKSLRQWLEEPANLTEQPPLTEKVNVQILSPNIDRVNQLDFFFSYENFLFRHLVFLLTMILQVLSYQMENRIRTKQ